MSGSSLAGAVSAAGSVSGAGDDVVGEVDDVCSAVHAGHGAEVYGVCEADGAECVDSAVESC